MSDLTLCVAVAGPMLEPTGAHAGRAAVMLRFASASDRGQVAMRVEDIVREVHKLDTVRSYRLVVTGPEAAERWTDALAVPLRRAGYRIHLETTGTHVPAGAIDWQAITPVRGSSIVNMHADEVRVIVDAKTEAHELDQYAARWRCDHYLVQPRTREDVPHTAQLVAQRPRWRFTVDLREAVNLPSRLSAMGSIDLQPGAEAETTLLA